MAWGRLNTIVFGFNFCMPNISSKGCLKCSHIWGGVCFLSIIECGNYPFNILNRGLTLVEVLKTAMKGLSLDLHLGRETCDTALICLWEDKTLRDGLE